MPGEDLPVPPGLTQGASPPVGRRHDAPPQGGRARRPRPRRCLLKGCEQTFLPRSWRARYCSVGCRVLASRWQAAKRQRRRRARAEVREQHRLDEKRRRERVRADSDDRSVDERGHAKLAIFVGPICDRPGCYEARAVSRSRTARFCCSFCRGAVQRVVDRERKWRLRATSTGRLKRELEYAERRRRSDAMGPTRVAD